jgi:hypothetical protein
MILKQYKYIIIFLNDQKKGNNILNFLDNIGFKKFRETSLSPGISVNQNNTQKQQDNQPNFFDSPQSDTFEPSFKRINDLDIDIINKNLFKFLPVDSLRIELQLEQSEMQMKDVEADMKLMSFLGYNKENEKFAELEQKKMRISEDINKYRQEYRDLGPVYKIADTFSEIFKKAKVKTIQAKIAFTGSSVVSGIKSIIPGLKTGDEIKETLNTSLLFGNSISSMLSTTVTPFGENEKRFKDMAQMMAKANGLDFKIDKLLDKAKLSGSQISDRLKNGYNWIKLGYNLFLNKMKTILPKKPEQENFFEVLSKKSEPPV